MRDGVTYWRAFGRSLGVEVLAPFEIELAGAQARFTALLPQFGAPKGMVVDANWDAIAPHKSALVDAGYGFSCVDAGDPSRFVDPEQIESAGGMLADWGWTNAGSEPDWLPS